jgi:hypothetical protein
MGDVIDHVVQQIILIGGVIGAERQVWLAKAMQ